MESSQVKDINRAITSLSDQARWLEAKYRADRQKLQKSLRILEDARQVFDEPTHRRGYVATLVPILQQRGGIMKLADMLTALRQVNGFKHVTLESLEATISSELRNEHPRLQRVGPRVYALARQEDIALTPKAA